MSAISTSTLPQPDRVLLRWSDTPDAPSREEFVDIVEVRPSETVVRCASQIYENTRVYIIKNDYTRIGIVKSCRKDQGLFVMEIDTAPSDALQLLYAVDPGVLSLDEWITEEQEAEILKDLDTEASRNALGAHGAEERQAWQVLADLQRLLRALSAPICGPAPLARAGHPRPA